MSKAEESCWLSEALLTFCMGLGEVGSLCCCSCFHYVELVWDFEHQRGFGLLSFWVWVATCDLIPLGQPCHKSRLQRKDIIHPFPHLSPSLSSILFPTWAFSSVTLPKTTHSSHLLPCLDPHFDQNVIRLTLWG
jgi:hypothetical protein